ncbi:MAG: hypothetical protein ABIC95_04420 [archaeon]
MDLTLRSERESGWKDRFRVNYRKQRINKIYLLLSLTSLVVGVMFFLLNNAWVGLGFIAAFLILVFQGSDAPIVKTSQLFGFSFVKLQELLLDMDEDVPKTLRSANNQVFQIKKRLIQFIEDYEKVAPPNFSEI